MFWLVCRHVVDHVDLGLKSVQVGGDLGVRVQLLRFCLNEIQSN